MKQIIRYKCDVCNKEYNNKEDCKKCESRGIPDITQYPIGCIDGDHSDNAFYRDITFAIALVEKDSYFKHNLLISAYACRDNGAGDNLSISDNLCIGNHNWEKGNSANINWDKPATKRLLLFLKEQGITPTAWDGEKAIPVNKEFL